MKLYFVTWQTNYGLGAAVIEASDKDECIKLCESSNNIWDGYDIEEIIKTNTNKILMLEAS